MSVYGRPNMEDKRLQHARKKMDLAAQFGNSIIAKAFNQVDELKQELARMKKNRDVAWERLEVSRITLTKKFEEIGQLEPDIVKMCCKDLLAQCILYDKNIDKLVTKIETAEKMCKDLKHLVSRRAELLLLQARKNSCE